MRILFGPMNGGRGIGPLVRCLAVAQAARQRGHECVFLIKPDFRTLTEEFEFPYEFCTTEPKRDYRNASAQFWTDIAAYLGLTDHEYVEKQMERENRLIQKFKPDVLFMESNVTLPLSAMRSGIPFASTFSWADTNQLSLPGRQLLPIKSTAKLSAINDILTTMGDSDIEDISRLVTDHAALCVIPTVPALHERMSKALFCGHLLLDEMEFASVDESTKWKADHKPRVYCYFGTCDGDHEQWRGALERLALNGFQVRAISGRFELQSQNLRIVKQASGGSLAKDADILIHPGTANTIALGAMFKKLHVSVPGDDTERGYNASKLQEFGVGVTVTETKFFETDKLISLLHELLGGNALNRASELQLEMREFGGPMLVVDALEGL